MTLVTPILTSTVMMLVKVKIMVLMTLRRRSTKSKTVLYSCCL